MVFRFKFIKLRKGQDKGFGIRVFNNYFGARNFSVQAAQCLGSYASHFYAHNFQYLDFWGWVNFHDNGSSIKEAVQEKIFEMFYRASEKSVGSGLGLYIVKETLKKIGGHINLESEIGKGSTLRIHIPVN